MDYPGKVITKTQVTPTQTSASGNWTLDDQAAAIKNNNWPVALVPNPISKSLRFNSADSAYLNRTFSTPTDNKKWTWSCWLKRSGFGGSGQYLIFTFPDGSNYAYINLTSSQTLELGGQTGGVNFSRVTSAVFRDASAWYAINVVVDTTLATANDRIKIYVNNVLQTLTGTAPSQNVNLVINTAVVHRIGAHTSSANYYLDGYLTEINFIDGQALDPSNFGLTNPQTGQWIPKKYTGTYGTNGFYLNFKDATSTTTLGYDYSGNANNWTTNNFSVTAGSGNDSLTDVPTPWVAYNTTGDVGGVVRGNYATWNPLNKNSVNYTYTTYANGNLEATATNNDALAAGTINFPSSGKFYFEVVWTAAPSASTHYIATNNGTTTAQYRMNGQIYNGGSLVGTYATLAVNDVIGVAVDCGAGSVAFYKNGALQTTVTSTAAADSYIYAYLATTNSVLILNCGQRPFAYTPPAGFRSLCTTNLPATTIGFGLTNQGDDYFNTVLYTGNGTSQTISTGLQPDFIWIKRRDGAAAHTLTDSVRGISKQIFSNLNDAEQTDADSGVTAISSSSITLGDNNLAVGSVNGSGSTYVAWNWNAGGSNATNTSGTITSTVRANTTAGFSIVTYTGNGIDGATVGHGLGVVPSMVIQKRRDGSIGGWRVWHSAIYATSGVTSTLYLNLDYASTADGDVISGVSSTTFTTAGTGATNPSGNGCVAYVFSAVPGYSAFGKYTGNASADGPFIYTGFRPEFVMIKCSSTTGDWVMQDVARSPYNVSTNYLVANASTAEQTGQLLDFVSNGFKIRVAVSGAMNSSGATYIYAAFAESPFQFANAR